VGMHAWIGGAYVRHNGDGAGVAGASQSVKVAV
jgi:hypothetical protein